MPFFSVVLPTYNRARMLPKAIESVMGQTFRDWELIIVDDGSTDNTKEIIDRYTDPRIHYIYQKNSERSAARNNGIEQAAGNFICFLDSDDYYLPEKLDRLHQHIEDSKEKGALFYDEVQIETGGKRVKSHLKEISEYKSVFDFLILNSLFSQQVCLPNDALKDNKFNVDIRIGEDVELWLRMSLKYNFIPVKNSFNTIIVEHDDRSVNLRKYNSAVEQLKLYKYVFQEPHPGNAISEKIKRKMIGEATFNIAKYYMYNNFKLKALYWILKSAVASSDNGRLNHYFYCAITILKGKIPAEYKSLNA